MVPPGDSYLNALQRLEGLGYEWDGTLSNHGPMAVDALVSLGCADVSVQWAEAYRLRLGPSPSPRVAIGNDWFDALGDFGRVADWTEYFRRELVENGLESVLAVWWSRLLPGSIGAAAHGLLRATHAVRASRLFDAPPPLVVGELAAGFGYWAARYTVLSEIPTLNGGRNAQDSLRLLPRFGDRLAAREPGITPRLLLLRDEPDFDYWANEYAGSANIADAFSEITREAAHLFVERGESDNAIALIHALTAPAAIRMTLDLVPEGDHDLSLATAWQLLAALAAAFTTENGVASDTSDFEDTDESTLARSAAAHGDEHAIKFTEACLREYAIDDNAIYLDAAAKAQGVLDPLS